MCGILVRATDSFAVDVESVQLPSLGQINVVLNENLNLPTGDIQADVGVLSDVEIYNASVSAESQNIVHISLAEALKTGESYSLLSIAGAEGSIDFSTPENGLDGYVVFNPIFTTGQDISELEITDPYTIKVTFNEALTQGEVEFKLLEENPIASIQKPDYFIPELVFTLEEDLEEEKDYIIMFIELTDVEGEIVEFDTGIYEFDTHNMGESDPEMDTMEDDMMDMFFGEGDELSDETMQMLAAGEDILNQEDDAQIEAVADNADETPDTGAETWVIVFATLFLNTAYFIRRKRLQK